MSFVLLRNNVLVKSPDTLPCPTSQKGGCWDFYPEEV